MVVHENHQICMKFMKINGFVWKSKVLHENQRFCMRNIKINGFVYQNQKPINIPYVSL